MFGFASNELKVEKLYYMYRQLMYSEAYHILKDAHLSEDAVSESFIRIIKNINKIDVNNVQSTKAFLVIVCRNVAKDIYRQRIYLNNHDDLAEDIYLYNDDVCQSPEDIYIYSERLRKLKNLIKNLDPKYRDVFILKRVHNINRKQIARICGISIETVKKRLTRAKAKLSESLNEEKIYEKILYQR